MEPARYEFQAKDGTWHHFIDQKHYENTKADGRWPIRALYTREQVIADLARGSGAVPIPWHTFDGEVCNAQDARESIASLQSKLEQVEALLTISNALLKRYRLETPISNQPHMITLEAYECSKSIDAALNKEPGHEA
jgi:hypothetical protein